MTNQGTNSVDLLGLLERALAQAATAMEGVGDGKRDLATPCRSWSVDVLQRHLLDDLTQFRNAILGGRMDFDKPVPEFDGDRAEAFRTGGRELLEAWQGKDLDAPIELPLGIVPTSFLVWQSVTELSVHTWDLMTATGQDTAGLAPEVAERALAEARPVLSPEFRGTEEEGKVFGPEQPVADDAGAYERLAAFLGRTVAE